MARRLVALGASNLTLGLASLVAVARSQWGSDVEVMTALGYGRSYGMPSTVGVRTLPGILECGLWPALATSPSARTRGLVTDVGNDVLYGVEPGTILTWVEQAVDRLLAITDDVVLTDLPTANSHELSEARFTFFRTILYPSCRLTLDEVVARAEEVNEGLRDLARSRPVRFSKLNPGWYGLDPIHFRPSRWRDAWRGILLGSDPLESDSSLSVAEWMRFQWTAAERQTVFGRERLRPQRGTPLPRGGRVWMY